MNTSRNGLFTESDLANTTDTSVCPITVAAFEMRERRRKSRREIRAVVLWVGRGVIGGVFVYLVIAFVYGILYGGLN